MTTFVSLAIQLWGFLLGQYVSVPFTKVSGGTSVTFDVAGAGTTAFSGTTVTSSHTITNGLTNTAVVAIFHWEIDYTAITGCTYNGSAMTQMWNYLETNNLFGSAGFVIATGSGTGTAHNVVCTTPSAISNGASQETLSFAGVNQTTPARTAFTDAAETFSIVVSNATNGDMTVDGITAYNTVTSPTANSPATRRANFANVGGNAWSTATGTAAATGSTTVSYTTGATIDAFGAAALAHN